MEDIYSDSDVYHPLSILGQGTFGSVLQCWRASDGELVALKAMSTQDDFKDLVSNELKLLAALQQLHEDHSHIVCFLESFRFDSQQYLVFEILQENLYQLQEKNEFKPLAVQHIRTICVQLLRALAKLREMAIIHADIKPENIMIVDQNCFPFRVKLIDFGSASFFDEVRFVKEPYIQSRFYRSPEILLGLPFSEKVDMWSLGCVLAELYLGWPLYPGGTEFEQVRYICETQGLPSPHLLNMASKTSQFFTLSKTMCGHLEWRLCPNPGSGVEGEVGKNSGTAERRKYILRSLDDLYSVHSPEGHQEKEKSIDCHCMVELLKRMLTIDSHRRINPSSALKHPFVTLSHLRCSESQFYYNLSLQELHKALIPTGSSNNHNWNPVAETLIPPNCGEQFLKDFPELNHEEDVSYRFVEEDLHGSNGFSLGSMTSYDLKPKHQEPNRYLQLTEAYTTPTETYKSANPSLNQLAEKMGEISIANIESHGWIGDVLGPVQNPNVIHCPHPIDAEHILVHVPLKSPQKELSSMLTSLNNTTQSIRQLNARPSPSDPSRYIQMFSTSHLQYPPEESSDAPQFFTAETEVKPRGRTQSNY
ncbi:homeodomain-interacting protein kinase 4-like isoform X2 [Hoplias malabaricus]|uniref:homeodomain-interacting protein kinase 4-like isoform X2 n=1 Tax=Hoplias malabaricus TaxID=27720 RepID=UPI0034623A05